MHSLDLMPPIPVRVEVMASRASTLARPVRDMPGAHQPFNEVDDKEQDGTNNAEQHDRREDTGRLEGALRGQDYVAETGLRGHKFTGDCADQRERDGNLHPGEEMGQGVWHTQP